MAYKFMSGRRLKKVTFCGEALTMLLHGMRERGRLSVDGLPEDARFVGLLPSLNAISWDREVRLIIESDSFPEVESGQEPPELGVMIVDHKARAYLYGEDADAKVDPAAMARAAVESRADFEATVRELLAVVGLKPGEPAVPEVADPPAQTWRDRPAML